MIRVAQCAHLFPQEPTCALRHPPVRSDASVLTLIGFAQARQDREILQCRRVLFAVGAGGDVA